MRALLAKRGVAGTEAAAAAISANAVQVAPSGMAALLATNSVAAAGTFSAIGMSAGTGTATLLKLMTATQIKTCASLLVAAGMTTALIIQQQTKNRLDAENTKLQQQIAQLETDSESLSNRLVMASTSTPSSDEQLRELMRLHGEVGKLREQNRRLQTQISQTKPVAATPQEASDKDDSLEEHQKQMAIGKMSDAKLLALAETMFAQNNQGQLATNYDQIAAYVATFVTNGYQPLSGSNAFELTYTGPISGITNPAAEILMRETQPWQTIEGKWAKAYVFGDGHAEVHVEPSENFDTFELQHTPPLPPSQ